jgi:hypothetical protein
MKPEPHHYSYPQQISEPIHNQSSESSPQSVVNLSGSFLEELILKANMEDDRPNRRYTTSMQFYAKKQPPYDQALDTSYSASEVRISLAYVIYEQPSSDETSRSRDVCSIMEDHHDVLALEMKGDADVEDAGDLSSNVFEVDSSGTTPVMNPS